MNIFITGVGSGLGRELTKRFLADGHRVWGIGRRKKEDVDSSFLVNANFLYSVCDVSDENQVSSVAKDLINRDFVPDAIILNAASRENDFLSDSLIAQKFKEIFTTNFWGAFYWLEFFLPIFQKNNRGKFIVVSSLSAYYPFNKNRIAYSTSKAALNTLFESLKLQLSSLGVRFAIFNFGWLNEKRPFLGASYQEAGRKIIQYVYHGRNNQTINYPLISLLTLKIISFIPPAWVKKYIISKRD